MKTRSKSGSRTNTIDPRSSYDKALLYEGSPALLLLSDSTPYGPAPLRAGQCSRGAVNSVSIIRGLFIYFIHKVVDGGLLTHVSPFRTPSWFCHFGSSELCRAFVYISRASSRDCGKTLPLGLVINKPGNERDILALGEQLPSYYID